MILAQVNLFYSVTLDGDGSLRRKLNTAGCFPRHTLTLAMERGNIWYVSASAFFFSILSSCAFLVREREKIWMVTVAFLKQHTG